MNTRRGERDGGVLRRRTKIVATLGPATTDHRTLDDLIDAGADCVRVNLSHGTTDDHESAIAAARRAAARRARPLAVLVDLPGPKLRLGDLARPLAVQAGDEAILGSSRGASIPVNFPELLSCFRTGDRVLVDDGAVSFHVVGHARDGVRLRALNSGNVQARKGVNLPDTRLPIQSLTDADRDLLAWGLSQDIDFVALSFVRSADDVRELRELIATAGGDQHIVAKIEKKEALDDCTAVIAAADAVMVARGDLGVEIDPAAVPIWQKRIIRMANRAGKPVITATQMLQSMIHEPRPTRAEASDVANAIYDGTSAVMLSGETAVGRYPVQAVQTMAGIASAVEQDELAGCCPPKAWDDGQTDVSTAMCHGACEIAHRIGAAAIATATFSGATARAVSRHRPAQPILGISPNQRVVNQLALCWGVHPLLGGRRETFEEIVGETNALALQHGFGQVGDVVVITAGVQTNQPGKTNLVKAHTLRQAGVRPS